MMRDVDANRTQHAWCVLKMQQNRTHLCTLACWQCESHVRVVDRSTEILVSFLTSWHEMYRRVHLWTHDAWTDKHLWQHFWFRMFQSVHGVNLMKGWWIDPLRNWWVSSPLIRDVECVMTMEPKITHSPMGTLACSLSHLPSLPPGDFRIGVESHEREVDRSTEQLWRGVIQRYFT